MIGTLSFQKMKNLIFLHASFNLKSNFCRDASTVLEGTWTIEDDTFEDFSVDPGAIIRSVPKYLEYYQMETFDEVTYDNSFIYAPEIRDNFISKVGLGKRVRILSLASSFMDDRALEEVTEVLISIVNFVDKIGILDLSYNALSRACAEDIISWIDKGVALINLNGNALCSMENVINLCNRLKTLKNDDMNEVQMVMRHIIFLPEYYINKAERKVKIFSDLCTQGYLPKDWATIQKSYYLSLSGKLKFDESDGDW